MVSIVPVASWLAALVLAALVVARRPRPLHAVAVVDVLLRWILVFPVGLMGLWGALGHIAFPAEAAASIGWAPSPFQYEVGVANLGIGLAGLYAAFRGFEARLATALMVAAFLGGAALGHVRDIVTAGNLAPGNAGPILVTDIATPLALLLLLALARRRA
ncbi:hypothetical protein PQJ75_10150 [Rhodoplanes sp. TEM]|uniref:DUF4345 domain-containing protein n=1 Tax=Rhodoplanes tepidamans TaxID=200616 RepID=A0ABT5J951_RHOTP|nr:MULTISPECIES: DUF6790 family protein [Rhodoplanes]MDC7785824.1 hypothetical protein [Rhodoplanes tepidamans]MDC7984091.1 hypothetical protein [Rhodoplanes sp. TEM]MDQ0354613.1 Na+/melibiose symporter-like transporter [Rhodoplanes tepidamans]